MTPIRVVVVDDSPLIRQILSDMLKQEPDIEVVGHAPDGREGARMVAELRPDVVTLDVEMPCMTGLEALREIMANTPTPVIMCSTLTDEGTATTMEALAAGAVDFVCKPNNGALSTLRNVRSELLEKIRHAKTARVGRRYAPSLRSKISVVNTEFVVLVASSTGGPRALSALFEALPRGFPAPMLMVQHMPPGFVGSLARRLDAMKTVPCAEAKVGDVLTPGKALIAPAGTHMRVKADGRLDFSSEATLHGVRPAADYLFESAAKAFGKRCIGVVLTGMGKDGAAGSKSIKDAGGHVFVESEETCTIYGMPRATASLGVVDREVPIHEMARTIVDQIHMAAKRPALRVVGGGNQG